MIHDLKEIIESGKTVDEATEKALAALGLERYEAEIEVISKETKGFLGIGSSLAKVRVTERMTPQKAGSRYLSELLNAMGLTDFQIEAISTDDTISYIVVSPEDMGFAIGYHGDALDAISTIVSLSVTRAAGSFVKVSVDINGYREKRVAVLRDYAQKAAEKASQSGYVTVANPMKPYERMILHSSIQDFSDVVSWSEGEDPRRRVIIAPISKVRKVGDRYERIDREAGEFPHARSNDYKPSGAGSRDNRSSIGKDHRGGARSYNGNSSHSSYPKSGSQFSKPPAGAGVKREDVPGSLYSKIDVPKK